MFRETLRTQPDYQRFLEQVSVRLGQIYLDEKGPEINDM